MQVLVFEAPWKASLQERDIPTPEPHEALVRTAYAAICGSDVAMYRGVWHGYQYPVVPGHEWAGEVVEVGAEAPGALVGKGVVGDPVCACGACAACVNGDHVLCENLVEIGFSRAGAFAEFFTIPVRNLYVLPDGASLSAASQVEPLAVAFHAAETIGLRAGERVAVMGAGGIGQLLLRVAQHLGATVTVVSEPLAQRRTEAARAGARAVSAAEPGEVVRLVESSEDLRPDVVFEASGYPSAVQEAMEIVRPGGRICLVGYRVEMSHPMTPYLATVKALTLRGVLGPGGRFATAVDAIGAGAIDVLPLLTNEFTLDEFADALSIAMNGTHDNIRSVFHNG